MKTTMWPAMFGLTMLMGCGSGTPVRIFVLSPPADPLASVALEGSRPAVEMMPVSLPDYLDTTDIFLRDGRNELKASQTGRWGERLSVGIAHALAVDLRGQLPGILVAQTALSGQQPARKLLADVEAFDIQPDGHCVLIARWTILRDDGRTVQASERDTVVTVVSGSPRTDEAVVSAMGEAVQTLSGHIAAALKRNDPGSGTPGGRQRPLG
jgi:uncharacterized lipoprotein YmbA